MSAEEQPTGAREKILIFIVAYNAQQTLADVVNRIDLDTRRHDVHLLIIDDASADSTFEIGLDLQPSCKFPLTVLKNPSQQGYGGNQKLGYHYAIQHGYQAVALMHADGQYAPETLGELLAPILAHQADAVFGSRMMIPGAARRGGMPLYKLIGNKVLTRLQNLLLHQNLSEFHSGYRVYSVAALRHLPFEYNTDGFHFDTEIIIQLIDGNFRILELPIPTYYGDEIRRVKGLRYAWDVVVACGAYWLHQRGIFYHYNYDVSPPTPAYEFKAGYPSSHTVAIERVAADSMVVDVACSSGYVARELHEKKGCRVFGIDQLAAGADFFAGYYRLDLDHDDLPDCLSTADYVLLLDILEHLADPEKFLLDLRQRVRARHARILITTPNIGFIVTRFMLLCGQFNYGRRGTLDRTHTRLFTFSSLRRLLRQTGFVIHDLAGIPAPFPKAIGNNFVSRILLRLNQLGILLKKRLFAYQIYAEITALDTVESLVVATESHSARAAGRVPPRR